MDQSIQYRLRYDQSMLSRVSRGPGQAVFVIRLYHKLWCLYVWYLSLPQLAVPRGNIPRK